MNFERMCPRYEAAFLLLGKRWTGLILRSLMEQPRRFSEITSYVDGLSDRVLSERLSELEQAGLVERRVDATRRPVLIEYALMQKGLDLRPVLEDVQVWADHWLEVGAAKQ